MEPLLTDRFGLRTHVAQQSGPVFDLRLAAQAKTGPKLQPHRSTASCEPSPDEGPTFLQALKEQLGPEQRAVRAPVNVIVIDHLDRPTAD